MSYIYILTEPEKFEKNEYKVGYTECNKKGILSQYIRGCPRVRLILFEEFANARILEGKIKDEFRSKRIANCNDNLSEWYQCDITEIISFILAKGIRQNDEIERLQLEKLSIEPSNLETNILPIILTIKTNTTLAQIELPIETNTIPAQIELPIENNIVLPQIEPLIETNAALPQIEPTIVEILPHNTCQRKADPIPTTISSQLDFTTGGIRQCPNNVAQLGDKYFFVTLTANREDGSDDYITDILVKNFKQMFPPSCGAVAYIYSISLSPEKVPILNGLIRYNGKNKHNITVKSTHIKNEIKSMVTNIKNKRALRERQALLGALLL